MQSQTGAPAASVEAIEGGLRRVLELRSEQYVDERAIVIEHRSPLIYMLCTAAELEHALICEYLFAAFSLKRSADSLTAARPAGEPVIVPAGKLLSAGVHAGGWIRGPGAGRPGILRLWTRRWRPYAT